MKQGAVKSIVKSLHTASDRVLANGETQSFHVPRKRHAELGAATDEFVEIPGSRRVRVRWLTDDHADTLVTVELRKS